ncbi:Glutamyl- or glutaminyl-tRNA synthetase [Halalkaliarchaeum sp. AArc-CO]|uniref:glutamate--tRNA ligase n=1 Tax=unclassified Halalkaliarchaeum TaxID=2678344 RepID=UPI00217D84B1|nr:MULTISPECIES: glutamate--tRNA ligase [unclassified Halalkaliarchaeum]MDR5674061.1 glutamate--tRNA ligase [Halalkaliarchaeum sp. AArc-GB]UWG50791.1 Glutamyl- or glutaminyl-tRNA synthetase [Halalkaliarchaeum sp. AArc-CO]
MDETLKQRVRTEAKRHALFNALKHGNDPDVGAIMGPLMGENPDFRPHGDEIPGVVAGVVEEVAGLSETERRDRLAELAPEMIAELEADEEDDDNVLPELPDAEQGAVVMRAAPNPNGPWHLGHARMPAVIGTYKDRYDGEFICRFDDTDPETKRPDLDAYDAILEDIDYLGFEPDRVLKASDRLETYYEHARELIELGGAYTCDLPAEEFSELKNAGEPSPNRDKEPETVREEFEAMVDGEYASGEMVLRVKTDIEHKNPALRDWVAFRIIDTPHPRTEAADYRCWPMLDFQSGIDDHLTGVTHIIRGIDLQDSAKRQRFVYDYFGWEYPEVLHWGHVQLDEYEVKLSTSTIKELIDEGKLTGWDDPRAPTLASVRRRGIRGEAIVEAMIGLGMSTADVDLAMSTVYANNRELVDDEANRYFLVRDREGKPAVEVPVRRPAGVADSGSPAVGTPPLHPDHEDRGRREIPVGDAVLLESDDLPADGERTWLKGFGCVRYEAADADASAETGVFVPTGDDIDAVREEGVPVVHWVPADGGIDVRMRTPDGDVRGVAEPDFAAADVDEVIQFERVGFVRVDGSGDGESVVYYAHP